jgi:predicted  nucleic acid-binding Zn-ribbon protein
VKADPFAQLKLLDVQALDLRTDQLRHQRANLPELAEIAELRASRTALDNSARDARIVVDDLSAEQAKVDADVEQVRARRVRDRDRMDSGAITNPKDLERMQHELASLERRIGTLEDEELEVMARLEDAQKDLAAFTEQVAAADQRIAALEVSRDEKQAEIDATLAQVTNERAAAAEGMPEDLMALYDKLRTQKGAIGAAALHQRRCTGCQLSIDASELARIKSAPTDEVLRCEECSRILVRTSESGI